MPCHAFQCNAVAAAPRRLPPPHTHIHPPAPLSLCPPGPSAPACRFPAVALPWAAALLRECDRQHQGIDLFGRDAFLLGRLLVTLGVKGVKGLSSSLAPAFEFVEVCILLVHGGSWPCMCGKPEQAWAGLPLVGMSVWSGVGWGFAGWVGVEGG